MIYLWKTIVFSYQTFGGKVYALLRFAMCPFSLMEEYLPEEGKIFDLGCGEGVFSQYLAKTKTRRQVIGVDSNQRKIHQASKAGSNLNNLKFINCDVFKIDFSGARAVILSDFLHHLPLDKQEKLLRMIANKLAKGGVLLIKEINNKDLIRSRLSRFWDFVFYPRDGIYYRDLLKLKTELQEMGFSVKIRKEVFYFPGSTNLLICTKNY